MKFPCDACDFQPMVEHDHGLRPQMYTFGLKFETFTEEFDLAASDDATAMKTAEALAERHYDSGWKEIFQMPAGGSGGLVIY